MQVACTQCGGANEIPSGAQFLTCAYCESALYVDRSRVVFHFVVSPTISIEEAEGKLRRWMAGNETVKDLDRLAVLENKEMIYFPMWRFVVKDDLGARELSQPARAFAIPEIKQIPLSGGDLKFFSPKQFAGKPLLEPEVLLESALQWLENQIGITRDKIKETNLIHIPFYLFKYSFRNSQYQAIVDAASGKVMASIYPPKAELPFIGISLLAAIAFFVAGLLAPGYLWRFVFYWIIAIPFGVVSYAIVRKF